MKYVLSLVVLCTAFGYGKAQTSPKAGLSPLTMIYLDKQDKGVKQPANYIYKKDSDGKVYISALIKVRTTVDEAALLAMGGKIGTKAGNIWTIQVPTEKVAAFTNIHGIEYIQLDEPVFPNLDSVRKVTRVDSVHQGLGSLAMPYKGKDVVVGIIDAGFDYRHPGCFDTGGTDFRLKRVWEQQKPGNPPAGSSYGNEIVTMAAMLDTGYDATISHGSHVSGIAAGSGRGSADGSGQYRGIAYGADLVYVGITPPANDWTGTGMSNIIDAMNYIYTYAASVGKPAVANLSWGCSIGPHDGKSLFSQACDNLTGPGKIFVCSAGNNGEQKLHLQKQFSATDSLIKSFVSFDAGLSEKRTWVDIWGDSSSSFCVKLSLYNIFTRIDSTAYICLDGNLHNVQMIGSNGDTVFAAITGTPISFNGKPRVFIELYSRVQDKVMITVRSFDGTVNLWNGYVKNTTGYYGDFITGGVPLTTAGNTSMTISDMASSRTAIAVGAYASKTHFTNVSGGAMDYSTYATLGDKAPFSSFGPTADGRVKPDITGPGLIIGSAINSYDPSFQAGGTNYSSVVRLYTDPANSREYAYAMLMGTSMSSPVVSGIVGLMLEANPALSPADVQSIVAETAIQDNFTTSLPPSGNNSWGHGKINAMAAVSKAETFTGTKGIGSPLATNILVYPNPASQTVYVVFNSSATRPVSIQLYDIMGRSCMDADRTAQQGYNNFSLNISGLAKGVYYLKLASGHILKTSKLIIE
jgi:minor extracellular serine protease Vpr